MKTIFTIGHSNHRMEPFVALLKNAGVTALADVRSIPFSRFQPHFNRPALSEALKRNEIAYVFLGRELGARSDDLSCYEDGRVQYRRLAATPEFRSGIQRVLAGAESHSITLMCAEKEPLECHRTLLVGRELDSVGANVVHIHADGSGEPHKDAMMRLLALTGLPSADLFRPLAALVSEACAIQESRTAYIRQDTTTKPAAARSAS